MKNVLAIIKISRPFYGWFLFLSVLIVIVSVLQMLSPLILKSMVEQVELQIENQSGSKQTVINLLILMGGVTVTQNIFKSINEKTGDYVSARLRKFLTEKFYQHVFRLPLEYFDNEVSGKIANQLNRGINTIEQFFKGASNFMLPTLLQTLFGLLILAYYSPLIAFLAFLIFPLFTYISSIASSNWAFHEVKKNKLEDASRGRIVEVLSNIKLVKSSNTQSKEWGFVSKKLLKLTKIYDHQTTNFHLLNLLRNVILTLLLLAISSVLIIQTFNGIFSVAELVLILQLINQIRTPLFALGFMLEQSQKAESGSKEFFELLEIEPAEIFVKGKQQNSIKTLQNVKLEIKNLDFKYSNSTDLVLKKLNFTISPKQTIALVGESGAGKSTIINLLLKFYEPTNGDILINEQSYKKLSHQYIRKQIALVFQDNDLFSSTIRHNVTYGIKDYTEDQLVTALKKAQAYKFIKKFNKGLESKVGQRGVKLSGGQKQRLQIARAILTNAPILILDEATSSLDSYAEKQVQKALDNLTKNRLVIVIAHRFSTLQNVDQIYVLDDGKIVDNGTPASLAQKPGLYQSLLKYQIEGNRKLLGKYGISL